MVELGIHEFRSIDIFGVDRDRDRRRSFFQIMYAGGDQDDDDFEIWDEPSVKRLGAEPGKGN